MCALRSWTRSATFPLAACSGQNTSQRPNGMIWPMRAATGSLPGRSPRDTAARHTPLFSPTDLKLRCGLIRPDLALLTVSHFYETHGGGIERVAGQLCRELNRLGATVAWAASDSDRAQSEGVEAIPLACVNPTEKLTGLPMPIPGLRGYRALEREIRRCPTQSSFMMPCTPRRSSRCLSPRGIARGLSSSSTLLRSHFHRRRFVH